MSITALCNPGENILLPRPGFALYETLAASKGIEARFYNLLPDQAWEADIAQLTSLIDANTTAVLINNPSNPCGSVFSRSHLLAILDVCERHRVPLISDEIYSDMIFDPIAHPFHPAASLSNLHTGCRVPVLTIGGLAKKWLVPGWRVGWILIHDPVDATGALRSALVSLTQVTLGANTVVQCAIPCILSETPPSFYAATRAHLARSAQVCLDALKGVPHVRCIKPHGAMFMMVAVDVAHLRGVADDVELCEQLLTEMSVACLPGRCFGYDGYVRIVFTAPEEILREACARIAMFIRQRCVV